MSDRIKKVLLAGWHSVAWREEAWCRGLSEIGIEVAPFDFSQFFGKGLWRGVQRRVLAGPAVRALNSRLVESAEASRPDVTLITQGTAVWPDTVGRLASLTWTASYFNDDPFGRFANRRNVRHFVAAIPRYGSHHAYREVNRQEFMARGARNVRILFPFYVPWLHFRDPRDADEERSYDHDIVFIGHGEPDIRVECIKALVDADLPLTIFGPEHAWRRALGRRLFDRIGPRKGVYGTDYTKVIQNSKICLAFFSTANRDQYTRRYFEIPASGGFLLGKGSPYVREWYREGEEAEFFDSPRELVEKAGHYLQNDRRRRDIALAGYHRCVNSGHDVASRMRQWVQDTQEFMAKG